MAKKAITDKNEMVYTPASGPSSPCVMARMDTHSTKKIRE